MEVKFGNKTIKYDPLDGVKDSVRTIDGVVEELSKRKDIKNLLLVIDDFCKSANIVLTAFQNDGHYVAAKKFSKSRKPKLPRKRKKACIKAQGRASYYSTVNLAKVEGEWPCKFWVNSTVEMKPVMIMVLWPLFPHPLNIGRI